MVDIVDPLQIAMQQLEDAKEAKRQAIDEARGFYFLPGQIDYMGRTFDLAIETYQNVATACAYFGMMGATPEGFAWIDYNNIPVPMTFDEFKGFAALLHDILQYGYMHSSELKVQVDACTTVEEVSAIPNW